MQEIKMSEERILESMLRKNPLTFFIVNERNGTVYSRNDCFEAGYGTLYTVLGQIDPKVIPTHKHRMNPKYVKFMNDENKEELLGIIRNGWIPWSVCQNFSRYL